MSDLQSAFGLQETLYVCDYSTLHIQASSGCENSEMIAYDAIRQPSDQEIAFATKLYLADVMKQVKAIDKANKKREAGENLLICSNPHAMQLGLNQFMRSSS